MITILHAIISDIVYDFALYMNIDNFVQRKDTVKINAIIWIDNIILEIIINAL